MTIRSHNEITQLQGNLYSLWDGAYSPYNISYLTGESYSGGDNARWLEAVKAGENATNALEAQKTFLEFRPIDMQATLWYGPGQQLGIYTDGCRGYPQEQVVAQPDVSHSPSALAVCVAQFNQKLQEQMRPVQGLVFIGELRKTIGMIKQTGRRLATDIGKYHKRARKYLRSDYRSRKALKGLSDLWLEHAFGWTPLYHDIAAAVKSLAVPRSNRVFVRGWGESRSIDTWVASPVAIGLMRALAIDVLHRNTNVSSAQQVAALDFSLLGVPEPVLVNSFQGVADRWGLTASQFVPAAWELIPYSFLVDYYINIGAVIDSAFTDRRAVAWGYLTQRTTAINEIRWSKCRQMPNYYYPIISSNVPGYLKVGAKRFSRESGITTIPPIMIGYPDFGGRKYANQLALILGRLRTR